MAVIQRATRTYGPNQKGFGDVTNFSQMSGPDMVAAMTQQGLPIDYATPAPGGYGVPAYAPAAASGLFQSYSWAIYAGAAALLLLALAGGR